MRAVAGDRPGVAGAPPLVLVGRIADAPGDADLALLDAEECRRLRHYERPQDAAAFAAGRALLRRAAAERLAVDPLDVRLHGPAGRRPSIAGAPVGCSVAHSGRVVVAAVGTGAIGVDVEVLDDRLPPDELAAIACDVLGALRDEVDALRHGRRPLRAFFERWTLTEAVLKAVGIGFAADPLEVELDLHGERGCGPRLVAAPGIGPHAAQAWTLQLLDVGPGYVAALAVDRAAPDAEVRRA